MTADGEQVAPPVEPRARASWKKRALTWALALVACAFVAWVVPIRDRCEDPAVRSGSTRVAVTRDASGCTLHIRSGAVRISTEQCAELKCEPGLTSTFERVRIGVVFVLLLVYLTAFFAWSARWRLLLAVAGVKITLWEAWKITVQAQAGGILLPGGIAGDALRIASIVAKGARGSIVFASVMLDRAIGLVTLCALASGVGLSLGASQLGTLGWVLALVPVLFVAGIVLLRRPWLHRARFLNEGRVGKLAGPMLAYIADPRAPRAIVKGVLVSFLNSAVQLIVLRGLVTALQGVPADEKWVFVGGTTAMMAGALPSLPGGWGTSDAAFVFFLGLAGLPAGLALGVSLLCRLFWYVSGVIGAVLFMLPQAQARTSARTP